MHRDFVALAVKPVIKHTLHMPPKVSNGSLAILLFHLLKQAYDVQSWAIVRIRADNPGYWISHCHMDFHMHNGFAFVLVRQ